ncbi:MAG: sulfotransferase [Frankiaceae bacterium]
MNSVPPNAAHEGRWLPAACSGEVSGTPAAGEAGGIPRRSRVRVLLIGGLGRSGTTLLERILCGLPGVVGGGEFVHLWRRGIIGNELCGCGAPFADCPFWRQVGDAAFGGWARVNLGRVAELQRRVERTRFIPLLAAPRLPPGFGRAVREYGELYHRVYRGVAEVSTADVVVDSSKHASLAFCLRWLPELDLRIVHVVRDSRAVAYSWTKHVARPEAARGGEQMARYAPARTAVLWNAQNVAFEMLGHRAKPVLTVRYEQLARDPAATLQAVARHAGLSSAPAHGGLVSGGSVELAHNHSVAGNPLRFRTGPVPVREDLDWRSKLPIRDRQLVTVLTAPLLAHYGYVRRSRASA